jgi:undecaprenyl-diphosphatase
MDDILKSVIMGIVEGLTEFVPVSSTGHLIVAGHLLNFKGDNPELANTYEVVIQLGAILAIVVLYWQRFLGLFQFDNREGFHGLNGIKLLIVVTIPALIIGFLLNDFIDTNLFNPTTVAIGLAVGGLALIIVERFLPKPTKIGLDALTWKDALVVGLCQCLALWPGTSRSAATMVGSMFYGVERKTAAEFSFFAAVPILFAASVYKLLKGLKYLHTADIPVFAVGFIVSFIVAWLAVKGFIRLLSTINLTPFGWYRLGLAAVIMALLQFTTLFAK